jgi:hypothetical protein
MPRAFTSSTSQSVKVTAFLTSRHMDIRLSQGGGGAIVERYLDAERHTDLMRHSRHHRE